MSILLQISRASRYTVMILFMMMHELRFAEPSSVADQWELHQRRHRQSARSPSDVQFFSERYHRTAPAESPFPWHFDTPFFQVPDEEDYSTDVDNDYSDDTTTNVAKRVNGQSSPRLHPVEATSCSCDSEFKVKDLGVDNYPRYISVSNCKQRTCRSIRHSCRLIYYPVHVLRKRDANESLREGPKLLETSLPLSLSNTWQMRQVPVAVACVPSSSNRRN
ncbi:prothoracicotropic hormone-like isoform X2 [Nomia melanderi]|uniref:prothoracicotropic hormone-like isoform X2 n=1 Tax=Nomia melanderi TaxID=2448451 RepID=UPI003FCCBCE1